LVPECNRRVKINRIISQLRRNDSFGLVILVGVQSNQFPPALDIARPLRQAGITVAIRSERGTVCRSQRPNRLSLR